ncbi:hypothetical protein [Gilvimarinus algae]|uniref:Phage tail protein n=1 Tax=Gilvimarinus algae TaxID=3058037 RepID=A0ABT8TH69_9GAMM|nr:hypothetical protein [Gilvimarinus sp. SDUM040014]MDO3383447.1 hypothetical protein [Gilvimarinus sp. SDUM040014]
MKADEVPQDNSSTYAGHKKLLYAQGRDGQYQGVQSSGWEVESSATRDAVAQFEQWASEARVQVEAGTKSPLYFHMYDCRMDLPLLCQLTGFWRWRVKRHFEPARFARLSNKVLARYADAMDRTIEEIKTLPEKPQ